MSDWATILTIIVSFITIASFVVTIVRKVLSKIKRKNKEEPKGRYVPGRFPAADRQIEAAKRRIGTVERQLEARRRRIFRKQKEEVEEKFNL
jgi:hypothetical protein